MAELNLSGLTVDSNGRVSFSGLSSGIDFRGAVDSIIAARRIPVDRLENRITVNEDKILAFQDLRGLLNVLRDRLDSLRGAVTFGGSGDIFKAKQVFASSSRTDGQTPAAAGNLVGVSVTNAADVGSHTLEVLQIARAHKVGSASFTGTTTSLGLTEGDQFSINGVNITVSATDTLADLRDRINNANSGTSATGVTASIVTASSSEHFLVLTADNTGRANTIQLADVTGSPLADLGISSDGGTTLINELQAPTDAQFFADGIRDKTVAKYESALQASATTALGSVGTLEFKDGGGAVISSVNYTATETITDLATNINNDAALQAAGIRAAVVQDGTQFQLEITGTATFSMAETGGGTVIPDLGIVNKHETAFFATSTQTLGSTGTLEFRDTTGALISSVAYASAETIQDLATNINGDAALQAAGITAAVVQDGSGFRLEISGTTTSTLSEGGGGTVITDLGFHDKAEVIERASNTVSDLFTGVTITLFNAERGTTIKLDVERDLSQVKTAVTDFVTAYNEVKVFLNTQTFVDPTTGQPTEDTGILFDSPTVSDIEARLANVLGQGVAGVSEDFSVLAQAGIDFVDNSTLADPLLEDTLEVDGSKLDEVLLNNPEDIRRLFAFDFSSTDPRVSLLGFTNQTDFSDTGYTLNIGAIGSAREDSTTVQDSAATLDDGVNSVGASGSGTFDVNGTAITYDTAVDTLDSLATKINDASINGVSASVISKSDGTEFLQVNSTEDALVIDNDTGPDLLTNLSFQTKDTLIVSANIDGAADGSDDGSVTVSGMTLTATSSTGADGLKLFYNGSASASGITLDFTVGTATSLFGEVDRVLANDGPVETEIDNLKTVNDDTQERIDLMLARLESQRRQLLDRFIAMETALASLNRILDQVRQTTEALFSNQNS